YATKEIARVTNDEVSLSSRGSRKGELKADALKRIERLEKTILLSHIYEKYDARKRSEHTMDFDDLLFELLKVLREDKLLLHLLQKKFLYVLVDEHQDTNDSQNEIVEHLLNFFETPN